MKYRVTFELQPSGKQIIEEIEMDGIYLDKLVEYFAKEHPDIAKTQKAKVYLIEQL